MIKVRYIRIKSYLYIAPIIILILTAFLIRIPIMKVRYFDPDEFQHLHGARQIYYGEIPYRDYFDHHTPLLHFFLALLYAIFGEEISIIFAARFIMLLFTGLILFTTFILVRRLYDTYTAFLAILFLSYVLIFLEKTLEIRPDVLAVVFWLSSMFFMVKGIQAKQKPKFFILSGIFMGTAIMTTQKTIFGLPGLILALLYPLIDRRTGIEIKSNFKFLISFFTGFTFIIILFCAFFLAYNAFLDFINCNFLMNANWKVRFSPIGYIKQIIRQNPFFPVMSLAGLFIATVNLRKKEKVENGSYIPIFCTYSAMIGLFIMPVPYRQYYQIFLPMLSMYSAILLKDMVEFNIINLLKGIKTNKTDILILIFSFLFFCAIILGLIYTLHTSKPTMPNFSNFIKMKNLAAKIYAILWIPFLILTLIAYIIKKREYAVMLIAIAIVIYPLDQMINQFSQKNDGQLANIKYIMNVTTSSNAVLDGWSGYGFLRPHAYYYYFLHSEMRAMLSEKALTDDLIESAERNNTKIVIYDGDLRALPQKTQDYINSNYVPTGQDNLYIRKEK